MKAQVLRIVAVLSLFVGIGTAQARSYYYHHGGCSSWGISWGGGGGWYGPYWGPPVGYGPGWWPGYYYPSTSVVITTQPTDVFYQSAPHNSNSILAKAQAQLGNLGYYKGPVDGSFGPATKKAVEMFQNENGLPVTGRLDAQTLRQLKVTA